jgi:methylaspartate mutase sigma subunit
VNKLPSVPVPLQRAGTIAAAAGPPAAIDRPARGTVVLTGTSSDAHTWNLVYLQLLLEELGWTVVNLGATTPEETVVQACLRRRPDLLVVSTVNGHGHLDGVRLMAAVRAREELCGLPAVLGGKLGVAGAVTAGRVAALLDAGFDAVFQDGDTAAFTRYLALRDDDKLAVTS